MHLPASLQRLPRDPRVWFAQGHTRVLHAFDALEHGRLSHFSIAKKLRLSLAVLAVGLLAIGFAYWRVSSAVDTAADTFDRHQRLAALTAALQRDVAELRRAQTA